MSRSSPLLFAHLYSEPSRQETPRSECSPQDPFIYLRGPIPNQYTLQEEARIGINSAAVVVDGRFLCLTARRPTVAKAIQRSPCCLQGAHGSDSRQAQARDHHWETVLRKHRVFPTDSEGAAAPRRQASPGGRGRRPSGGASEARRP